MMLLQLQLVTGSGGTIVDLVHVMTLLSMSQSVLQDTVYLAMSLSDLIALIHRPMTSVVLRQNTPFREHGKKCGMTREVVLAQM